MCLVSTLEQETLQYELATTPELAAIVGEKISVIWVSSLADENNIARKKI